MSPVCPPLVKTLAFPSACRSDNQPLQPRFGGRRAMIFGYLAGWTNWERAGCCHAVETLVCGLDGVIAASCHLPTEVSSWFELVLAPILSTANSTLVVIRGRCLTEKCDFFFSPRAQACNWSCCGDARLLVVYHSELCYWFCDVHGSNSSGNIEQYLSSIRRT